MGLADEFTLEMAHFITETPHTEKLLTTLTEQNAFVKRLPDGKVYRFHHMMKECAKRTFHTLPPEKQAAYRSRFGIWYEEHRQYLHAMAAYRQGRNYDALLRIVEQDAGILLSSLPPKAVLEAIEECPVSILKEHPLSILVLMRSMFNWRLIPEMMRMKEYLDVLIPRGGASLIASVVENSTVPVIETGTGNCHIYVDEFADIRMAAEIIENAKTQRLGVCNACESLVIHEKIAEEALPVICDRLSAKGVEIRGDEAARQIDERITWAQESDWGQEYLDAIISAKIVPAICDAVRHINKWNTGHSEAIITKDYANALYFQERVDAAAVYVNASTRFTDGNEFGFGAEIGISTQKLHARGPMGQEALTTKKYVIFGNGQIRG